MFGKDIRSLQKFDTAHVSIDLMPDVSKSMNKGNLLDLVVIKFNAVIINELLCQAN